METFPSSNKLLLVLILLVLSPLLHARQLGGSYDEHLRLPSDDGAVSSKLGKAAHGVSRSGGRAPPAPKHNPPSRPMLEQHGGGVSNGQQLAPALPLPPPRGSIAPQHRSTGVVLEVLGALGDAAIGAWNQ